jgi:ribonucleoside-diphosphate reductase alpha chain
LKDLYNGVAMEEVRKCVVLAARTLIEKDPAYSFVTARLLLDSLRHEAPRRGSHAADMAEKYPEHFPHFIQHGVKIGLLNEALLQYDMKAWRGSEARARPASSAISGCRRSTTAISSSTNTRCTQMRGGASSCRSAFFMRVAMGLALNEVEREARAIEFYNVLSTFDFMSSTPTLFNSGTHRSQLSSCYLTTVSDDLDGIYEAIKEKRALSKFAGGLGNDWTNVRAMGSHIKGTNGKSQGVVPFLKVVNDTAVAVNQGGKRKGAVCTYLETWHLDIEEFLELRKNTGDDRRRTHDMNTANWIPDLFMKRVIEGGDWTLFSPADTPTSTTNGAARSRRPTRTTRRSRPRARSSSTGASPRSSSGARCCRCCSRRATRGSRSRTPATSARRSSTWAPCTARTSAPRSRSIPAPPKSPCATSARSTCSRT